MFCRVEITSPEPKPLFQLIQNLINKLSNGQQVMEEVNQIMCVCVRRFFSQILSECFHSLLSQVDQAIVLCSEMHNIKEAIYENKTKLEGIGEDYQIQVHGTCDNGWRMKRWLRLILNAMSCSCKSYCLSPREAVPKITSSVEPFRAWSAIST